MTTKKFMKMDEFCLSSLFRDIANKDITKPATNNTTYIK